MRKYFNFWRDCIKWSYWRWEGRELIATIFAILFSIGGIIGTVLTQEWWIALIPLGICIIFIAPYKLWKAQEERADKLEESRKSSLDVIEFRRQNGGMFGRGFSWGLRVHNKGTDSAENCDCCLQQVRLVSNPNSLKGWPTDVPFDWQGQQTGGHGYTIPGGGFARIIVFYYDYPDSAKGISASFKFAYPDKSKIDVGYDLLSLDEPILLLFYVSCNGSQPLYVVCSVDLDELVKDLLIQNTPPCRILSVETEEQDLSKFYTKQSILDKEGSQTGKNG